MRCSLLNCKANAGYAAGEITPLGSAFLVTVVTGAGILSNKDASLLAGMPE